MSRRLSQYLTVKEVAERLHYRRLEAHEFKGAFLSKGDWRIPEDGVLDWIETQNEVLPEKLAQKLTSV